MIHQCELVALKPLEQCCATHSAKRMLQAVVRSTWRVDEGETGQAGLEGRRDAERWWPLQLPADELEPIAGSGKAQGFEAVMNVASALRLGARSGEADANPPRQVVEWLQNLPCFPSSIVLQPSPHWLRCSEALGSQWPSSR